MKVLLLSHRFYPDFGGIETVSEFIAQALTEYGHEVRVLTWTREDTQAAFPYKVIRNPNIKRLFSEHVWADVVFENNPCLRLAWPNYFIVRPLYVALHTWITREDGKVGWQDFIKLRWLNRAVKVTACSEAIRQRSWQQATVIGNTYHIKVFRRISEIPRINHFVFLGRLVSDKGADLAIKAFHLFMEKAKKSLIEVGNPLLTIIGEGPERERLLNIVADLKLLDNVDFKGVLRGEPLARCLNQHKFLLIPSVWEEPFGIVALEGMACGCVPIASDSGGLKYAIGDAGLYFEKGNVESLSDLMNKAVEDNRLLKRLQNNIAEHLEQFHPKRVAEQYIKIFEPRITKEV